MKLINGDCLTEMKNILDNEIDLTVTSPPYDNLRTYNNSLKWGEHIWKSIIKELYRITKTGGVVVWVVGDATINGSETGTSFKQALHFKEVGFNLHDTMIYQKAGTGMAGSLRCYIQAFEYMFVFSKLIPKTINIIRDRKNIRAGKINKNPARLNKDGDRKQQNHVMTEEYGRRLNIWKYGHEGLNHGHPAIFPKRLAKDHIITWSNEKDVVFDPFMGSGTTGIVCKQLNRDFVGIELDTEYSKIAETRIKKAVRQDELFTEEELYYVE